MTMNFNADAYATARSASQSTFMQKLCGASIPFYLRLILKTILPSSRRAKKGRYSREVWIRDSFNILGYLERVGVRFHIEGMDHMRSVAEPVVFIGNHMSTLETFILPCLIEPLKTCTFVVKEELMNYPVFGPIMRAVQPIAVSRTNPKEDFMKVMDEGTQRLRDGMSVIIFPQTTRTTMFQPDDFNSLGIKLARRAGVPILPIAMKTDAWGNGKRIRDFGKIDPSKIVHISFGKAMQIAGRGQEEHAATISFIEKHLARWSGESHSH